MNRFTKILCIFLLLLFTPMISVVCSVVGFFYGLILGPINFMRGGLENINRMEYMSDIHDPKIVDYITKLREDIDEYKNN